MRSLSLTQRVLLIAVVSAMPIVVIVALNLWTMRTERTAEMHESARQTAHAAGLEIDRIIGGVDAVLMTLAVAPDVSSGDRQYCTRYLTRVVEKLPQLLDISIIDPDGYVFCTSAAVDSRVFLGDRSYFTEARAMGGRIVGEYTVGRLTPSEGLPVAIPIEGPSNLEGGVAVALLDLAWLGERLRERILTADGSLTVADRNGRILTREPLPEQFVGTQIPGDFAHLLTAENPGTLLVQSQDGTERIIGFLPVNSDPAPGIYLSAGLSTAEGYALINRITLHGVVIGIAGILTALVLAIITSNVFIRRPFRRLIDTIEAWQDDKVGARTGMGADLAEFGRAGRALDAFMDLLTSAQLQRREAEQRREILVRELDHRVKNLLATVQAVAHQTFRGRGQEEASRAFHGRLAAMGSAHQLLMGDAWQSAPIHDLVAAAVRPFDDPQQPRFVLSGPQFDMDSRAAMALSMGLHCPSSNDLERVA